jgi:hypothetical protein
MKRILHWTLIALALLIPASRVFSAEEASPVSMAPLASAAAILESAFVNRYSIDLVAQIELVMHGRGGQTRARTIRAATKVIDGRVYSIGRLLSPEYLRDMTILMIETEDRGQDAFIFMPSLDKVRRITTAQRSDAFFGSDVTYEDIEQQRADDFEFDSLEEIDHDGERAYVVHARPARKGNYARAVFTIAKADSALLGVDYYKRNAEEPYRVIEAPRAEMVRMGDHILPTHLSVENRVRGTRTEVYLEKMSVDVDIPRRVFSVRTLESRAPLPRVR